MWIDSGLASHGEKRQFMSYFHQGSYSPLLPETNWRSRCLNCKNIKNSPQDCWTNLSGVLDPGIQEWLLPYSIVRIRKTSFWRERSAKIKKEDTGDLDDFYSECFSGSAKNMELFLWNLCTKVNYEYAQYNIEGCFNV